MPGERPRLAIPGIVGKNIPLETTFKPSPFQSKESGIHQITATPVCTADRQV